MSRAPADAFWGDRAKVTDLDAIRCKGSYIAARRRYVEDRSGAAGVAAVSARVEPPHRALFDSPPLPFTKGHMSTVAAIDLAICDEVMHGNVVRMKEFGEDIARADVNGVYRAFFRLGTPQFFLRRLGLIYRQYIEQGDIETMADAGRADLTLRDVVLPHYLCAYGICGWIQAAIELSGGKAPIITHTECLHRGESRCQWRAEWR